MYSLVVSVEWQNTCNSADVRQRSML